MVDKFEGMNDEFKEGYAVGVTIANSSLASGIDRAADLCERVSASYKIEKSADFVYGMESGIGTTLSEAHKRMYGPRESMRKVMGRR